MAQARDDYDSPWKQAIAGYFPEFMAFYFPQAHAAIDWDMPHLFLEQELTQVTRNAALGKRLVDKLVQVTTRGGVQEWVLVHLEVQSQYDRHIAQRIFTYNYRIYDRFKRPVASLVLLADSRTAWRPSTFVYRLFGCSMQFDFPIVKLNDYRDRIEELLLEQNPFALLTAAHLLTRQSQGQVARRATAKWRLAGLLFERSWELGRIMDFLAVIDWMMFLPEEMDRQFRNNIHALGREHVMRYVPSWERITRKDALKEGRQEGRLEGQRILLTKLLQRRFGDLSEAVTQRLARADMPQLLGWADALFDAETLDQVFEPRA